MKAVICFKCFQQREGAGRGTFPEYCKNLCALMSKLENSNEGRKNNFDERFCSYFFNDGNLIESRGRPCPRPSPGSGTPPRTPRPLRGTHPQSRPCSPVFHHRHFICKQGLVEVVKV